METIASFASPIPIWKPSAIRYMSSANLSQKPQLMLPHSVAVKMDFEAGLLPAERRWLTEDVLKEFRKTARLVGAEPWRLFEAQSWLQVLCDENERKVTKQPPQLRMVLEMGVTGDVGCLPDYSDLFIPDDPDPRVVKVAGQSKRMKRPAAAAGGGVQVFKRPALRRPAAAGHGDEPEEADPAGGPPEDHHAVA